MLVCVCAHVSRSHCEVKVLSSPQIDPQVLLSSGIGSLIEGLKMPPEHAGERTGKALELKLANWTHILGSFSS